jgi:putative DNA primase/helicase
MLDYVTDPCLCPHVTLLDQGPRYSAAEIRAALPPKASPQKTAKTTQSATTRGRWDAAAPKVAEAVEHFKMFERGLWDGNWQTDKDRLTGYKPFPSQSEADYYLARCIARWGMNAGLSGTALKTFVEDVFEQSALAKRDKWKDRADYRTQTISKACANIPLVLPQLAAAFAASSVAQPDWSLKGDLIGARFFKDRYVGRMVYVVSLGKWLRWDATKVQWVLCELGEHIEAAKATVLELYRLACQNGVGDHDAWKGTIVATGSLQVESRIKSVLELAKSESGMSVLADALDSHPELLGVRNGVVDLRTGRLCPNNPALYITKYVEHAYTPSATCAIFTRFLDDVFQSDSATIAAVHRLVGLTLTGSVNEEVIIFCVGTGANGKSIFGNVVSAVMGPHSTTAPSSLLAARRADDHGPRSDLAMLHGARIVSINELPGGMMLDENVTKQLAGREPISARFLYHEHFSFLPRFTPWVRTNHRPIIKGTDNGIWRRMLIVPFRRTFAPQEQDNDLEAKIMREAEGVLAWMVEGAQLYLQTGLKRSPAMSAEVARYRTDSDLLGEFLADKTVADAAAEIRQSALFSEYKLWCDTNGLKPCSKRVLTEQLTERGFGQRKSGADRFYTGLKCTAACIGGGS